MAEEKFDQIINDILDQLSSEISDDLFIKCFPFLFTDVYSLNLTDTTKATLQKGVKDLLVQMKEDLKLPSKFEKLSKIMESSKNCTNIKTWRPTNDVEMNVKDHVAAYTEVSQVLICIKRALSIQKFSLSKSIEQVNSAYQKDLDKIKAIVDSMDVLMNNEGGTM